MTDPHPVLADFFASLDRSGVEWAVVRDWERLAEAHGDVDLLVAEGQLADVRSAAVQSGFVSIPLWGHGPRAQFASFDVDSESWLKLDVVWELGFGSDGEIKTDLAPGCLQRRRRLGMVSALSSNDAYWALLLHCLLDKTSIDGRHIASLQSLVASADPSSEAGQTAQALVGSSGCREAVAASRGGDGAALATLGQSLRSDRVADRSVGHRVSATRRRWQRRLIRILRGLARPGAVVAAVDRRGRPDQELLDSMAVLESKPVFTVRRLALAGTEASDGRASVIRPAVGWAAVGLVRLRGHTVLLDGVGLAELEHRRWALGRPVVLVRTGEAPSSIPMSRYDVVTVPDGGASAVAALLLRRQ